MKFALRRPVPIATPRGGSRTKRPGSCVAVFNGHAEPIANAVELSDGRVLSWCTHDSWCLWRPDGQSADELLSGPPGSVDAALELHSVRRRESVDLTPSPRQPDGRPVRDSLNGEAVEVVGILQLRDGRILARSGSGYGSPPLRLWHSDGRPAGELLYGYGLDAIQLIDGRLLFWSDVTLKVLHLDGRPAGQPWRGHTDYVSGALRLRDDRILSWSHDCTLRLWRQDGEAAGGPLRGHTDKVSGALELSDGRIVSWSDDHTLRVWDENSYLGSGRSQGGYPFDVRGAMSLRDGRTLTWMAEDPDLRLWLPNGMTAGLHGHTRRVLGALQLHDGRILSWSG